jgi:hypothetical protein
MNFMVTHHLASFIWLSQAQLGFWKVPTVLSLSARPFFIWAFALAEMPFLSVPTWEYCCHLSPLEQFVEVCMSKASSLGAGVWQSTTEAKFHPQHHKKISNNNNKTKASSGDCTDSV